MNRIGTDIKRKIIQIAAFGFTNSRLGNFAKGKIYTGEWKKFCTPGLNCYSCPAATFACPIGAMQAVAGSVDYKLSFYVVGFLLAIGVIFGRFICGYICPFGLIQELLFKVPVKKVKLPKWMTRIKYIILVVFVLLLPIMVTNYLGMGDPAFCKYICPVGTLEGGIPLLSTHSELRQTLGGVFALKVTILAVVVIASFFVYRFFCKVMCPLGAIYALFNKISFVHMSYDKDKCIGCGKCANVCKMDVNPVKDCNSTECIRCGKCIEACPTSAIHYCTGQKINTIN